MRVYSLGVAASVASVEATRGLRTQAETSDLSFSDLHGDVASGLSFDTLGSDSSTFSDATVSAGTVRDQAASDATSQASAPVYSRPNASSFYDVVGDLSSKWARFGDEVAVPGTAKTSLATTCTASDLDACLKACAKLCYANNACQWFTLAPSTQDCYLYRSLKPVAGDSFASVAADAQRIAGYVKTGMPALLSAKATCSQTTTYNEQDSFCFSNETTYYIVPETTETTAMQCATSPLTLLRTFQNNFFNKGSDTAMTEELANGKLKNAKAFAPDQAGGDFTIDMFLQHTAGTPMVVTTADLKVDEATQQLTDAGTSTQWSYSFDASGRVTAASSSLSKKNLLYSKDATTGKMVDRKDYCKPLLQTRFAYSVHALAAVEAQSSQLTFGAGQIASCMFTSPNGFWNMVPQSDKSRTTGCWKQANDLIAKLLEWGFTVEYKSEPKYFSDADAVETEATAAAAKSKELLTTQDVATYYTSTGSSLGDLGFHVDFPCAYYYRPYAMQATIKLADCAEGAYCQAAWPAIQKSTDSSFFSVTSDGEVQISRAMAHWAFENQDGGSKSAQPTFTYLKSLATASSGLCFTETGKSLQSLTLSTQLTEVFLVTKEGNCVSLSGEDGTPSIVSCDEGAPRYTVDASAAKCIAGSGDACPTFAFTNAFESTIALKKKDDLVAGTLSFGSKGCLVVDESEVRYSTDKTDCSTIKATYIAFSSVSAGDPVDPDAASTTQDAPVVVKKRVEIDDPDPELA